MRIRARSRRRGRAHVAGDAARASAPKTLPDSRLLAAQESACERIVWTTRIDQISPAGTQQVSNLVDRPGDRDARLAGFELALELDERAVGGVEPTDKDRCDVKRGHRIAREQSRCISDIKLRTFEGPHVSCMWLIAARVVLEELREDPSLQLSGWTLKAVDSSRSTVFPLDLDSDAGSCPLMECSSCSPVEAR
jgi:hypothetical protein